MRYILKRVCALSLVLAMALSFTACGKKVGDIKLDSGVNAIYIDEDGAVSYGVTEKFADKDYDKDALEGVLRIRSVAGDKIKLLIFERDHPPLVVEVVNAHAVSDGKGCVLCEDGCAGIALFLGRVPKLKIPREVNRDLLRLQFRLL